MAAADEHSSKYFRTPHVPWSRGSTHDDEKLSAVDHLLGCDVVVTEKIDGENHTWTHSAVYARSHSGPPTHASASTLRIGMRLLRHLLWGAHTARYCCGQVGRSKSMRALRISSNLARRYSLSTRSRCMCEARADAPTSL